MIHWHLVPEPVVELVRRLKAAEHPDGTSPGSDVVDIVYGWLNSLGIPPDVPASQIPGREEHVYERTIRVTARSHWELDEEDLGTALTGALVGTAFRVELAGSIDTDWVELDDVRIVDPAPN